jgi:hypothetical protein
MQIIDVGIDILGATGYRVNSEVGIASTLKIGGIEYENVIFDVIEDSLLGVPKYNYFVKGIVGADLMYPLGIIQISSEHILRFPDASQYPGLRNFAFKRKQAVMCITYKDDSIPVKFDTGSPFSMFYKPMYTEYEDEITKLYKKKTVEYGGIGGRNLYEQYIIISTLKTVQYILISVY